MVESDDWEVVRDELDVVRVGTDVVTRAVVVDSAVEFEYDSAALTPFE